MKALLLNPNAEYEEGYEEKRENYIEVQLLAYDRDKYVLLEVNDGFQDEVKSGYLRRIDNFGYLTKRQLFSLPQLLWAEDERIGKKPTKREVQKELREDYKLKTEFTLFVSNGGKGLNLVSTLKADTLDKAIRIFNKYRYSQLLVSSGRWNKEGIAERDKDTDGVVYYDIKPRNNRPTYSSKVLRVLSKS